MPRLDVVNDAPGRGAGRVYVAGVDASREDFPAPERKRYKVTIEMVENGFIIHVGCKTFVTQNWVEAATALDEYWRDPDGARRKFCCNE